MDRESKYNRPWRIIIGGTIGNLTEWYNFLLYGYLASVISQLFFPSHNSLLSLTLTFTVFALSFFVRPLGGIFFGWIGDTYGRQRALIISVMMMAVPTFLIGCLPTYHSIGVASPILLSILRIFQGFSAGGEHTGSAVYIAEHAPTSQRGLWTSTVPASAAMGIMISSLSALLIVTLFTHEQLLSWGWRTGYWAGTLLCLVSLFLRVRLPETPSFQKIQKEKMSHRSPVSVLLKNPEVLKKILWVFSLSGCWGVFYQLLFIWMPTYLAHTNQFSHGTTLQINSIFMAIFICLIVCAGFISDHINRKFLLASTSAAMFVVAYPLFTMLSSGSLLQTYFAMAIFTVIFSLFIPPAFICMIESFNTSIRYSGLSFGFNMGLAIFGGTCPLIATWLIEVSGSNKAPAFYVMLFAAIALLTSLYIQDKKEQII